MELALTKRDEKIEIPIELTDLDVEVKYLTHRHFEPRPLRY